jgi:hypothetical protein
VSAPSQGAGTGSHYQEIYLTKSITNILLIKKKKKKKKKKKYKMNKNRKILKKRK